MNQIKRVKTGIKGFDSLVQGGFPAGTTVLLCGTPGTGKSIFGIQFIHNGGKKFNEKSMYVTFEQTAEELRSQSEILGYDFKPLEKAGKVKILAVPVKEIDEKTIELVKSEILRNKIKRIVVDSISTLSVNAPIYSSLKDVTAVDIMKDKTIFSPPIIGDFIIKKFIYGLVDDLRNIDHCTSLLISEASEKGEYLSRDTISEFVCDGVVLFTFESMGGEFSRSLIVRKMRRTNNDEDIHPLEISDKGLIVHTIK